MMIIQKNQVLALLLLLSPFHGLVEAKKTRDGRPSKQGKQGRRPPGPSNSFNIDDFFPKAVVASDYAPSAVPEVGPDATPKVIGGEDAPADEYPWYSRGVTSSGSWWGCGGTLITPEFVLTAAHCGYDTSSGFQIGALCDPYSPTNNCDQDMETIYAKAVYDHPGWDAFNIVNDFTLVQLKSRSTIEPIDPDFGGVSEELDGGEPLWVIGLGADLHQSNGNKEYPDHVKHAEVLYVNSDTCSDIMGEYIPGLGITDVEMCAGPTELAEPDVGTCNGDSGGPIIDKVTNTLLGVTSWGLQGGSNPYLKCGMTPGVYARISDQWEEWIKPNICENHSSPLPDFCDASPPTPGPLECANDEKLLQVELTTDDYGEDTTIIVIKEKNSGSGFELVEAFGSKLGNAYGDNEVFTEELCVDDSVCYKVVMYDEFGDGLCCEWGSGGYRIIYDGVEIKDSEFTNGQKEITNVGSC